MTYQLFNQVRQAYLESPAIKELISLEQNCVPIRIQSAPQLLYIKFRYLFAITPLEVHGGKSRSRTFQPQLP